MFNKCKIVLLPTNEKANICLINDDLFIESTPIYGEPGIMMTANHLYILSDEEIKEGDWVCDLTNYGLIHQVWKVTKTHFSFKDSLHARGLKSNNLNLKIHFKKIIATTDSSLTDITLGERMEITNGKKYERIKEYLPSIPQSFIDNYISEYNKGNKIETIMVEYITNSKADIADGGKDSFLKVNSDNTINIKSNL